MAIPKRHGPSRTIETVPLGRCEICLGEGVLKGIFHEMRCAACTGSGLVHRDTGESLELEEMVVQLRLRLNYVKKQLAHCRTLIPEKGAAEDYGKNRNRRGTGGGNWTGD